MATSGTTSFSADLGSLSLYAYQLIGVRPTAVLQEHMESARMAANMVQSRWSAEGVNLWRVDLVTVPLVQGQATYSIDPNTIVMLDTYIATVSGGVETDRNCRYLEQSMRATRRKISRVSRLYTGWIGF